MNKQYSISIYLDTRRTKKNKLYPVKLRVYAPVLKKQKLYPTIFEFSKKQFNSTWDTKRPLKEFKDNRLKLQAVENKANKTASSITPFSFEQFERKLYRKAGEGSNVFYHYELIIERYKKLDRIGTASNYDLSLKSLKKFLLFNNKDTNRLLFNEITPAWLNNYENYMLNKERSRTTIGIYLRPLRAVFNIAISNDDILPEIYPFGRKKYQIPAVKKTKRALTTAQLKQLFEAIPQTPEQEKAKNFWFLSYNLSGMNTKDIAMLRFKDIQEDKIVYYRAKTINTAKADLKAITVYLNDFSRSVIEKYSNPSNNPRELIFSIINDRHNATEKHRSIQNFVRFINQNIKKLAINEGLPGNISTYWARHSFATNAIRHGASMEFVSEALNHSDLKTTQSYFAGFEDEAKKELMKKIMEF